MRLVSSMLLTSMANILVAGASGPTFFKPAEDDAHFGTMMTFPTNHSLFAPGLNYKGSNLTLTRQEIVSVARAIAKYEPVHLFVWDDKTLGSDLSTAKQIVGNASNITIHPTPNVDSLWARDIGPVFVTSNSRPINNTYTAGDAGYGFSSRNTSSETVGIIMHFNQWGRKSPPSSDSVTAGAACDVFNLSSYHAPFTAEGGALEFDGEGTLLATESSVLNPNRNPGIDKAQMEQFFKDMFGIQKTIWLPGVAGGDITDDHIDSLARFASPGTVLLDRPYDDGSDPDVYDEFDEAKDILENETDAKGRKLKVVALQEPSYDVLGPDVDLNQGPTVSYVNYYLAKGAVILAKFGDDDADENARQILQQQYPDRVVEQVYLHQLGIQGGGIHCATQQILP